MDQCAYSLIRQTTVILQDKEPEESNLNFEIRKAIEDDTDTVIADLHIWQVGVNKYATIISLVAHELKSPEFYKNVLRQHEELIHPSFGESSSYINEYAGRERLFQKIFEYFSWRVAER